MGIIPLQYLEGQNAESLGISGKELYSISLPVDCKPGQIITVNVSNNYIQDGTGLILTIWGLRSYKRYDVG